MVEQELSGNFGNGNFREFQETSEVCFRFPLPWEIQWQWDFQRSYSPAPRDEPAAQRCPKLSLQLL